MGSNPIAPINYKQKGKQMTKNNILEFYNIGTKVKLDADVYATIISVNISSNNSISYECGWWNGRSYCKEVFNSCDIENVIHTEKTRIGFI